MAEYHGYTLSTHHDEAPKFGQAHHWQVNVVDASDAPIPNLTSVPCMSQTAAEEFAVDLVRKHCASIGIKIPKDDPKPVWKTVQDVQ